MSRSPSRRRNSSHDPFRLLQSPLRDCFALRLLRFGCYLPNAVVGSTRPKRRLLSSVVLLSLLLVSLSPPTIHIDRVHQHNQRLAVAENKFCCVASLIASSLHFFCA
ncbi:hypothetical protein L596_010273 [Steinernema carpocapsae]|uniref:Uncharacterized protein n=1 Tax=Steinernema carpocapsae TaxID=34508 RepID=A0A4U5PJ60_STECR|nr:hypothetical protein L596_010273 [Steinernema carpocapsae]